MSYKIDKTEAEWRALLTPTQYHVTREKGTERAFSGDNSLFMRRTEVACSRCGAHRGSVFPDGPAPTGVRDRINSASIDLDKRP